MMITTIAVFFSFFHSVGANSETPLDTSEVNEFLSSLKKRFHSIQTYKCKMILESFEGDHKIQNQRLWYKKPGYVRIEQTGPFKKGAVVVIHPNAKIWGHLGGALSIFKAELEPENPILMGVTKDSAVTADYGSILEAAMDRATRVVKYEITQAEESGKPVMILDFFFDEVIDRYRLVSDAERRLIIRIERYSKDELIHTISWSHIEVDIEIKESLFEL